MNPKTPQDAVDALPAWDLSTEYSGIEDTAIEVDFTELKANLSLIREHANSLASAPSREHALEACHAVVRLRDRAATLVFNLLNYIRAQQSCDVGNPAFATARARFESASSELELALQPVDHFLKTAPEDFIVGYLRDSVAKTEAFRITRLREEQVLALSPTEESLLSSLSTSGLHAWGNLYQQITGVLEVEIRGETHGVASARQFLSSADPELRREATFAIDAAYRSVAPSVAQAWSAIVSWSTTVAKRRSKQTRVTPFQLALRSARLSEQGFEALWEGVRQARSLAQQAVRLQAKALGKNTLDLWDLRAPDPMQARPIPWFLSIDKIQKGYQKTAPEMGEFIRKLIDQRWIDARLLPNKISGAFCTLLPKSRTSRILMSYTGGMPAAETLAHELGHAYHNWVQRDLPLVQTECPATLAETASAFSEHVFLEELLTEPDLARPALLHEAGKISIQLLFMPMRFEIEREVHDRSAEGGTLGIKDFDEISRRQWLAHFGDTYTGVDETVWLRTMHNYMTHASFYNFPYTFGFLFSSAIHEKRGDFGSPAEFHRRYVSLLRETGTSTCEELARKHLEADITDPGFWIQALVPFQKRMEKLEKLI